MKPPSETLSAQPGTFDQNGYTPLFAAMASAGHLYVPASCRATSAHCALHVVFHGCKQSASAVGDDVYARLGYNQWADNNAIVILYPQVDASLLNPMGCWDWWGYTGSTSCFATVRRWRRVAAMIARLEQPH